MHNKKLNRIQQVADLLNAVGQDAETKILSTLEEANPNLAHKIRARMFSFEDLIQVDSRQMQLVLNELDQKDLVLALKIASDAVKELVFSSMSKNSAEILRKDLENLGPSKRENVEAAQSKTVQLVRKFVEEGKIILMDSDFVWVPSSIQILSEEKQSIFKRLHFIIIDETITISFILFIFPEKFFNKFNKDFPVQFIWVIFWRPNIPLIKYIFQINIQAVAEFKQKFMGEPPDLLGSSNDSMKLDQWSEFIEPDSIPFWGFDNDSRRRWHSFFLEIKKENL